MVTPPYSALGPDGKRQVSGSWDNALKVWDLDSGALLGTFTCDGASSVMLGTYSLKATGRTGLHLFVL
jgi:WD40 repeat protein